MSTSLPLLILPGLGNSGPDHWQSHWQRKDANAVRLDQADWDAPACKDWLQALQSFLEDAKGRYVIVAHSAACALVAHFVNSSPRLAQHTIAGALLVAPSDPEGESYPKEPTGFAPVPAVRMPFPTIVVSSDNDIYVPVEKAREFSETWGARFVLLANAGHINANSGHGEWPEGYELAQSLRATA